MWKIEIRDKDDGILVKRKLYESQKSFDKWLKSHNKQYGSIYSVIPYKYEDGNWKKII